MDSHLNERIIQAHEFRKNKTKILETIELLKQQIRELNWKDIVLIIQESNGNTLQYNTEFPSKIQSTSNQLKTFIPTESDHRYYDAYHMIIYGHQEEKHDELDLYLALGNFDNKVDVLRSGLPYSLRGLGIGAKLYKRLMLEAKFISSEIRNTSFHSDLVWEKLTRDEEVHVVSTQSRLYACLRNEITGILSTLNGLCENNIEAFFPTNLVADLKAIASDIETQGLNALYQKITED